MALLSGDNDHVISSVSGISYGYMEHKNMMVMMEKRQLFLRSYQFCRKRTLTERIKRSLVGVKRVMWLKLRSARKLKRLVLSRLDLPSCVAGARGDIFVSRTIISATLTTHAYGRPRAGLGLISNL